MPRCVIHREDPLPDEALRDALRELPTTSLSDVLGRVHAVRGLRPLSDEPNVHLSGPVLTVRTTPGDNLVIHKAIDLARPGEVLFVDAGGYLDRAVAGEVFCRYAEWRGIAGLAVDGVVRDSRALMQRRTFPVFSRGMTHAGPYKEGSGEIRGTITVGDVAVRNGDFVVGDMDGLVVIPGGQLSRVVEEAHRLEELDAVNLAKAATGEMDRAWIDAALDSEWRD